MNDDAKGCLLSAAVILTATALACLGGWLLLLFLLGKKWSELG